MQTAHSRHTPAARNLMQRSNRRQPTFISRDRCFRFSSQNICAMSLSDEFWTCSLSSL